MVAILAQIGVCRIILPSCNEVNHRQHRNPPRMVFPGVLSGLQVTTEITETENGFLGVLGGLGGFISEKL